MLITIKNAQIGISVIQIYNSLNTKIEITLHAGQIKKVSKDQNTTISNSVRNYPGD